MRPLPSSNGREWTPGGRRSRPGQAGERERERRVYGSSGPPGGRRGRSGTCARDEAGVLYQQFRAAASALWHDCRPAEGSIQKAPAECKMERRGRLSMAAALVAAAVWNVQAGPPDLPHVHLLATGGTISGGQQSLDAAGLTALVPGLAQVATVTIEDVTRIGSSRMTPDIQFRLATRINELFGRDPQLAGIVVTHGTDTLEETAFLVDLLVRDDRPVVFAAAQRPPRESDSDGPRNLLNAFRIAASSGARGVGTLVTLNDEIHSARHVRKTHAVALDAFQSPGAGPVGFVDGGRVAIARRPASRVAIAASRR